MLNNWRPISLLNISYKIYSKLLQHQMHLLMTNVISEDQSAFLPNRYILDHVLTQYEIIQWTKEIDIRMVLLKLDFRQAYNIVLWEFLFVAMLKMGMSPSFMDMVHIIFLDAESSVVVNGELIEGASGGSNRVAHWRLISFYW